MGGALSRQPHLIECSLLGSSGGCAAIAVENRRQIRRYFRSADRMNRNRGFRSVVRDLLVTRNRL